MFEYSGAIHMHSTYSDGTGTVPEIAGYANESELDFIILTDHNNMKAKEAGYEKWFGNTMLIVGYEINDISNKNHYLVMGMKETVGSFKLLEDGELGNVLSAKEYVSEINKKGGFGFIAHPDEIRAHIPDHPSYPWNAWDSEEFTGIEIWNHMSEWIEGLNEKNKLNRFIHPLKSIISPPEVTLKRWDDLNQKRKVTAIGGVDAHAHKQNVMGFFEVEIFAYKILFKSIRTHVLLDEEIKKGDPASFEKDRDKVLNALRNGNSFIVNHYHGSGAGFRFFAEYDGISYCVGEEIKYDPAKNKKIILRTYLPEKARIKLIQNGKCIDELDGIDCIWDSDETGTYRIECWKEDKGWIFSNHIRIISG